MSASDALPVSIVNLISRGFEARQIANRLISPTKGRFNNDHQTGTESG